MSFNFPQMSRWLYQSRGERATEQELSRLFEQAIKFDITPALLRQLYINHLNKTQRG